MHWKHHFSFKNAKWYMKMILKRLLNFIDAFDIYIYMPGKMGFFFLNDDYFCLSEKAAVGGCGVTLLEKSA